MTERVRRDAPGVGRLAGYRDRGPARPLGRRRSDVTAVFAAGEISGSGGVNRYTATYEAAADGTMTISQPAATLMAGPPAAMKQEQAYFAALEKAAGFSVTADSLALTDDQGTVLVRYEASQPTALQGTKWEALRLQQRQAGAGLAGGVELDHGRVRRGRQAHWRRLGQPLHAPATRRLARRCRSTRPSPRPRWPAPRS